MANTNNKTGNNKGKKSYYRRKTNKENLGNDKSKNLCSKETDPVSNTNDPAWYGRYPQLQQDAGRFSFTWANGMPIILNTPLEDTVSPTQKAQVMPGIMSLELAHTLGFGDSNSSAVNVAMRNVYSFVRYANSGSRNYEAADLMLYILGMNEIYSVWSWMRRVYGICRLYSPTNRYYPLGLLAAMNVDESVLNDLANLRYAINTLATKLSSMAVPGSMPYTARRLWLYNNIYTDATSAKAQLYMFQPKQLLKFALDDNKAGKLAPVPFQPLDGSRKWTVPTMMAFADSLFNLFYEDEESNIMSGDILKSFGSDGIVKFPETPDDYVCMPIYDDFVMAQIENSCTLHINPDNTLATLGVTQDVSLGAGFLVSTPKYVASNPQLEIWGDAYSGRQFVNAHIDSPDSAWMFEATRLKFGLSKPDSEENTYYISCGTELVVDRNILSYNYNANGDWVITPWQTYSVNVTHATDGNIAAITARLSIDRISALVKFQHFPMMYYPIAIGTDSFTYQLTSWMFDADVWTTISYQDIEKLNDVAALSLFDIPLMASAPRFKG